MAHIRIDRMKVRKVGSSLVVTIPKAYAAMMALSEGDLVNLTVEPLSVVPRLDPALEAALTAALDQTEDGLRYLAGQ
jgi:antitoxin component of MazEF toxin-antitoxin module